VHDKDGHPVVVERDPLPGVLKCGPDYMLQSSRLGRVGHVCRLLLLLLRREVLPEVRDTEGTIGPVKRPRETLYIVEVGLNHLGTTAGEFAGRGRVRVAREGATAEAAVGVVENGSGKTAALGTGSTDDGDDFMICHSGREGRRVVVWASKLVKPLFPHKGCLY